MVIVMLSLKIDYFEISGDTINTYTLYSYNDGL
jgi:hypothetical protein